MRERSQTDSPCTQRSARRPPLAVDSVPRTVLLLLLGHFPVDSVWRASLVRRNKLRRCDQSEETDERKTPGNHEIRVRRVDRQAAIERSVMVRITADLVVAEDSRLGSRKCLREEREISAASAVAERRRQGEEEEGNSTGLTRSRSTRSSASMEHVQVTQ
jgi:hypothetical protein